MTVTTTPPDPSCPAFLHWFRSNRPRSRIGLVFESQTNSWVKFSFEGFHSALRGSVSDRGITVQVTYEGVFWDIIFDAVVSPERSRGGFFCAFIEEHPQRLFADLPALLAAYLFEPFLAWANDTLAPANYLVLNGDPTRLRWLRS